MGGFLDTYGAGEEKRGKTIRTIVVSSIVAVVAAVALLFIFNFVIVNRGEKNAVNRFFQLLAAKDYKQAYAMFGCTDAKPCRDYSLQAFLDDWGAQAVPVTTFEVLDGESCGSGVIVDVDAGKAGDRRLWVERKDHTIGSLPPNVVEVGRRCPQGNRLYDFVRGLRYRLHGRTYQ